MRNFVNNSEQRWMLNPRTPFLKALTVAGALVASAFAGVTVSSPSNYSTVSSPARFVASASSDDPISAMAIYVDGNRVYRTSYKSLDTKISMSTGSHTVEVKAWDTSGTLVKKTLSLKVSSTTSSDSSGDSASDGKIYDDVEEMDGWGSCTDCAADPSDPSPPLASYWRKTNVSSPSMDGDATEYHVGGTSSYANALWWKRLEGDASLIRKGHNFIYDTYFYYTKASAVQALEFDINQLIDGKRYIWGTQCNVRAGGVWDIWNNIDKRWVHTSIGCSAPPTYKWNHLVLEMQRTSDNKLRYISITLNGNKHYLNKYYSPSSTSWTGLTMNFQMDMNKAADDYSVWLDNFKVKWW
jgi:hypothetical protein